MSQTRIFTKTVKQKSHHMLLRDLLYPKHERSINAELEKVPNWKQTKRLKTKENA